MVCVVLALWAVVQPLCVKAQTDAQTWSYTHFDFYFQRSSARWMPEHDWEWLRAQCFVESRFQPRAVSPVGARGVCQFMPGTWHDASRAIGVRDIYSPQQNIHAAGWYMRRMLNIWIWDRTDYQRLQLAQASYNTGAGNVLAAQRICDSARTWQDIAPCLPQVTGRHSAETIGYVQAIERWRFTP